MTILSETAIKIQTLFIVLFLHLTSIMPTSANTVEPENAHSEAPLAAAQRVEEKNLEGTIAHLQGLGGRMSLEQQWDAARWAAGQLQTAGLKTRLETYEHKNQTWPNVVAEIRGRSKPGEIVLVIAHIDSIADNPEKVAPGADDDGTGVAVVLEIARILRQVPLERTVLFCLFTNEEKGAQGSKHFARYAREHALDIRSVINLDVLGYNAQKAFTPLEAIRTHYTVKHKIKAIYRMSYNYLRSMFFGRDRVKIAGRNEDASLVNGVAQLFEQYADLGVKRITGGGCA